MPKKSASETFKENVEEFIDIIMSRYSFCTYEDTHKILVYLPTDGIYKPADSTIEYECCQTTTVNTPSAKSIIEMNIRGRTYTKRHDYSDAFCVLNGVLIFENKNIKLVPHSPKLVFESRLSIPYDPKAECPVWEACLESMLPSDKDRLLLQEWFGYHFVRGQPYEKALFITGKPSTGKSTTLFVLDTLLGGCASHAQLSDFQKDSTYAEASLYGKLGNTYSDMGQATILDVGKFKVLTGSRDQCQARFPYEKPFNFRNSAKFTFACNKLPPLSGNVQGDLAFWKRILLIQFSVSIKNIDVSIYDKLSLEMSGILNWALKGYIRLLQQEGKFTKNTDDVYQTWNSSAYAMNPLEDFIEDMCVLNPTMFIECNMLRAMYDKWCAQHNEIAVSAPEFRACLALKGIFEKKKVNKDKGTRELVWMGISWI